MNWLRRITGHADSAESGSLDEIKEASVAMAGSGVSYSDVIQGANKKSTTSRNWGSSNKASGTAVHVPSPSEILDEELSGNSEPEALSIETLKALSSEDGPVEYENFPANEPIRPATAQDFHTRLQQGLVVNISELEQRSSGSVYNNFPVMVFAVDLKSCPNPAERQDFFYQVHLFDCCTALQNPAQQVMISTSYTSLQKQANHGKFELCHDCLEQTNYLDYSHRAHSERNEFLHYFDFTHYVMTHGSDYFPDRTLRYWPENSPLLPLKLAPHAGNRKCCHCQWSFAGEESYFLSHAQSDELKLPHDICLLCAQDKSDTAIIIPGGLAEYLYQKRFRQLQPTLTDWQSVRHHLDKSWHSLTYILQRQNVPLPQLYLELANTNNIAPMAWPTMQQAVVSAPCERQQVGDWEVWCRDDVLKRFLS